MSTVSAVPPSYWARVAVREPSWDGTAVTAGVHRSGPLGVRLAARLAEAAAGLLTEPAIGRLKRCETDNRVMLLVPPHPRRRWCAAGRCGNRTRVARRRRRGRCGRRTSSFDDRFVGQAATRATGRVS
ncbi:CGNR zinc finger domain-containing protein [Streptomyces lavendulocolor]|uniref:CGNR zinc finger domain-containing protein n=1 Tax=Streptomyces lavendulocolor TaxID=67316 RepID=UPI0031D4C412